MVIIRSSTSYCDDGNAVSGDGWDSTCSTESKWDCSGGSSIQPDDCNDIWGDGYLMKRNSNTYWDDGNTINGDGCSSTCTIEANYIWNGGTNNQPDTCIGIWGDGILFSGTEEWDDGNLFNNDGCDSSCKLETSFQCFTNTSNIPNSRCTEVWGDGIRTTPNICDDGNTKDGDGWSSQWLIESGYACDGGSSTKPDTCVTIWGDGYYVEGVEGWDDGNKGSSDGWSSNCLVEAGYVCVTPLSGGSQICSEICGDGKRFTSQCDDGNTKSNDGCSSTCTIEPGFICSGGTATRKDTCTEIWGDGKDYGTNECEDGNLIDGDGWSSSCEYETWYACTGGTPTSIDSCFTKYISVTEFSLSESDSTTYIFTFNDTMQIVNITQSDMVVSIDSSYLIEYDWSASYINSTQLSVTVTVQSVLMGTETLKVKFINSKKFRTDIGGCLDKIEYSIGMETNLGESVSKANVLGLISEYLTYSGLFIIAGVMVILGGSLEMLWSLINTLQIISYLPLMTPYFPEHVKVMFRILESTNLDFAPLANIFKKYTKIDSINVGISDSRFESNGIESPLFLDNAASLILSFGMYLSIPLLLWISTLVWRWEKLNKWLKVLLAGYFFNNFLRFFTEGYLEVSFWASLNVSQFTSGSSLEIFSFGIAVFTVILWVMFPWLAAALLYDNQKEIAE